MDETQPEPTEYVEELRAKLEEAEETLRAIRSGEVDALVVMGPEGEQIFTLQGAEHPYRQLIETISEGAVTLSPDGNILYCNRSFAALLRTPLEQLLGANVADFISPADAPVFKKLLEHGLSRGGKEELMLAASDESLISAYLSIHPLQLGDMRAACLVVTDLTEQKREEQLRIAHEELERRVVERTAELAQTNASLKAEIGERVAALKSPISYGCFRKRFKFCSINDRSRSGRRTNKRLRYLNLRRGGFSYGRAEESPTGRWRWRHRFVVLQFSLASHNISVES